VAPFTFEVCPRCSVETRQRWFAQGADGDIALICEQCFAVLTHREDGSVECRAATDEERARVPPPVTWSEQEWAAWRGDLRQGQADLRAWFRAGRPGLTPELERAFPDGTLERVRRLIEGQDVVAGLETPAEPGAAPDTGRL
jgi:hypothetical protein